jgi:hypothetical protein
MALRSGRALLLASLLCGLGCTGSLSSAHAVLHRSEAAAGAARRGAGPARVCAFAASPAGPPAAGGWAGRPRSACAAGGALRLVCLNNESRRPKRDDRFVLPHSRFEGRFVPIQEQMTFQAEMEALDGLDEAERSMEAGANDQDKFDKQGDVTFGLRIEMSAGFSKKSVEARSRWKCPEYREKVISKRGESPDAHLPVAGAPSVQHDAAAPPCGLPRLEDVLFQSDVVSWRPDDGGWVGTETLLRTEKTQNAARRGAAAKTLARGGGESRGADAGDAAKKIGAKGKGGAGARSKAMQKKVANLKLMHSDQNAWMAQRLSAENALPLRGEPCVSLCVRVLHVLSERSGACQGGPCSVCVFLCLSVCLCACVCYMQYLMCSVILQCVI